MWVDFGMRLKEYLKQHSLTVEGFAAAIGESPFTVGKWVRGDRRPREATMLRIVDLTSGLVTPNDFYDLPANDGEAA